MTTKPEAVNGDELRERTRRSIARLISIQRGDDTWNDEDYITAGNILFVCKRLIDAEATKDRKKHELRARIDLLKRVEGNVYHRLNGELILTEDYIAQLESELKALDSTEGE